jgi:L-ornithine N5-monooxygenase
MNGVFDVAGVGFGPANLSLAIAIQEHNEETADRLVSACFVERQQTFGWHRGMLIDGATMQISFLKDLALMRNPVSRFGFLKYLHDHGRLIDFINHKMLFPTRVEFHDYLEWAARNFDHQVRYGTEVVEVRPVFTGDTVDEFEVVTRPVGEAAVAARAAGVAGAAGLVTCRARNLVLAAGLAPSLPPGVVESDRVWHNYRLLDRLAGLEVEKPRRFVVVGAGQSAAETVDHLERRYPEAEICAVFARYGYSPADDSPFANQIFDPSAVDDFYGAPDDVKAMLDGYHRNTNYGVVDMDLIEELYRRAYQQKVAGVERLRFFRSSRIADLTETATGVKATIRSLTTGETRRLEADAVVFATGYRSVDPSTFLGPLRTHCLRDSEGRLRVDRNYQVMTTDAIRGGIYLQGPTEASHGISSTLLSNSAVRAGEILHSLLTRTALKVPSLVGVDG